MDRAGVAFKGMDLSPRGDFVEANYFILPGCSE
jgi:hypothetical protein